MIRDIIIFFAGAEAFHTLSHFFLPLFVNLPITIGSFQLTPALNIYATAINAIITAALIFWARRLHR